MRNFNKQLLLSGLEKDVTDILSRINEIRTLHPDKLNKVPSTGGWTALQVIEHLNSYNRYYLPQIQTSLSQNANSAPDAVFKSGRIGNYFTKIMLPGADGNISKKMSAPKDHVPQLRLDAAKVLQEFIAGEEKLLHYLKIAYKKDIGKIKTPISISKFIKLKLGDTFRFLIAHQQRHFVQLNRTLE